MFDLDLKSLFGINLDIYVIALAALVLILIIIIIINGVKSSKLKKSYNAFMQGKNMESLEDTLLEKLEKIEKMQTVTEKNSEEINRISNTLKNSFQKIGMVKYDAFNEMGGKLSFSIALLNQTNDGFIINAMHSREGCYTYIKEIVKGNSYIVLSEEEQEALSIAKGEKEAYSSQADEEK